MNDFLNFTLAILIAGFLVAGCSPEWKEAGGEVDAVYWHEGTKYTVAVENADLVTQKRLPPWGGAMDKNVRLYTDVAGSDSSWYKCEWEWSNWNGADLDTAYCDIHIHSLDELVTADWNHCEYDNGLIEQID